MTIANAAKQGSQYYVRHNKEKGFLQIFFDERPEPQIQDALQASRFGWYPGFGAWMHPMDGNESYDFEQLSKVIGKPELEEYGSPFTRETRVERAEREMVEKGPELEAFNRTVAPFDVYVSPSGGYGLALEFTFFTGKYKNYCQKAFDDFARSHGEPPCDEKGMHYYGNGYDWERVFQTVLQGKADLDQIRFDSEAGRFFCYSDNYELLKTCATEMHAACENKERLSEIIEKALLFHVSAAERVRQSTEQFPPASRVRLHSWNESAGARLPQDGTVESIDSDGVVHIRLDNGEKTWCDIFYGQVPEKLPQQEQGAIQNKPVCELIGHGDNFYYLAGIAAVALQQAGLNDQAAEMTQRIMGKDGITYAEAIGIMTEYVNITAPKEAETGMIQQM